MEFVYKAPLNEISNRAKMVPFNPCIQEQDLFDPTEQVSKNFQTESQFQVRSNQQSQKKYRNQNQENSVKICLTGAWKLSYLYCKCHNFGRG